MANDLVEREEAMAGYPGPLAITTIPQMAFRARMEFPPVVQVPKSTPEERRQFHNLLLDRGERIQDHLDEVVDLVGWAIQSEPNSEKYGDPDGSHARISLLCANGNIYSTGSVGVYRSLMAWEIEGRNAPWSPPIKARIVNLAKRSGGIYYGLLEEAQEPAVTVKPKSLGKV